MKGQNTVYREVTVACFGGRQARMLVLKELENVLLLCSPEEMEAALAESREPVSLGFKRESVLEEHAQSGRERQTFTTGARR